MALEKSAYQRRVQSRYMPGGRAQLECLPPPLQVRTCAWPLRRASLSFTITIGYDCGYQINCGARAYIRRMWACPVGTQGAGGRVHGSDDYTVSSLHGSCSLSDLL